MLGTQKRWQEELFVAVPLSSPTTARQLPTHKKEPIHTQTTGYAPTRETCP